MLLLAFVCMVLFMASVEGTLTFEEKVAILAAQVENPNPDMAELLRHSALMKANDEEFAKGKFPEI